MESQYLAQALGAMQAQQPAVAMTIDPTTLAAGAKKAKVWKAQNPDQSYLAHAVRGAGQALAQAPANIAKAPANLAGIFKLGGD